MVITSKRHLIQDEKEMKCNFMNNPQGYCIEQFSKAGMRHLEWRSELHSIQFSQFRKITRQIHQILQNLTHNHTNCL